MVAVTVEAGYQAEAEMEAAEAAGSFAWGRRPQTLGKGGGKSLPTLRP